MRIPSALLALTLSASAHAAIIDFNSTLNGVYSTGFNTSGNLLSSGAADPHYVLIQTPAGCSGVTCQESSGPGDFFGPGTYVVMGPNGTFPLQSGVWLQNDANSQWIGPRADQTTATVGGSTFPNTDIFASDTDFYVYRTVFNLTGLGILPATAAIQLAWGSDDSSAAANNSHIRLCAITSIGDPVCGSGATVAGSTNTGFSALTTVNINSGFTAGLMALDFVVYNQVVTSGTVNPSGVRVDIISATGSDQLNAVPEPSTALLLGLGAAGLFSFRSRRR